jgi:hypothetical protein
MDRYQALPDLPFPVVIEALGYPLSDSNRESLEPRNPRRCQASTVAGFTNTSTGRQPLHVCDNHAQSMRSAAVRHSRGRRDRFTTAERQISRCSSARGRAVDRSAKSSETTTDSTSRAYSRRTATSISTTRSAFLVGTPVARRAVLAVHGVRCCVGHR